MVGSDACPMGHVHDNWKISIFNRSPYKWPKINEPTGVITPIISGIITLLVTGIYGPTS